jgi:hypothetical protein
MRYRFTALLSGKVERSSTVGSAKGERRPTTFPLHLHVAAYLLNGGRRLRRPWAA